MFSSFIAHWLIVAIVALSILLMLLRPRRIAEAYWVCGGALLLIGLQLIPLRVAWGAVREGTDVYLFLTGMMLLSELARIYGVFDWLASAAAGHARGSSNRLFTLIYGVGTLVTVFMSNDATAVVLTPAVLFAVRKVKANPLPYLFGCALIANAASFVLPISNPANLVVFRLQMPSLAHWLAAFLFPSILSIVTTYVVLRLYFRHDLRESVADIDEPAHLTAYGKVVVVGILLFVVVLLAMSALNKDLGLPTFISAVVIAAVILVKSRVHPWHVVRDISWSVLPLVAGLFVLVAGMESVGALQLARDALRWAQTLPGGTGAFVIGGVVGIGNNIVNNLPLGLMAGSALQATHAHGLIANAVLIGVDLGPNLSVTGSLATILWLIVLRREGLHVSFGAFLKVGLIAMPIALALALGGAILLGRG